MTDTSNDIPAWAQDTEFKRYRQGRQRERAALVDKILQRGYELRRSYEANTGATPSSTAQYGGHQLYWLMHHHAWMALLADPRAQQYIDAGLGSSGTYGQPPARRFMGLEVVETYDIPADELRYVLGPAHVLLRQRKVQWQ